MPTTISLTPQISALKPTKSFEINLASIFRTKAFKITLEAITLLSLFTAIFAWMFILKTI